MTKVNQFDLSVAVAASVKERMIQAAERLFARRGINAVSLREIRAAAGQRNTAAVHYHFGTKRHLMTAIIEYRMQRIDRHRLAMLADLERDGRADDLRSLVEALFYPFAASVERGSCYARFLAQATADAAYSGVLQERSSGEHEGIRHVQARLERVLRGLPPAIRSQRLVAAWRMWIQVLAEHERELEAKRPPAMPTAALASDLVDMIVVMFSVPVSPVTRHLMRSRSRGPATTRGAHG